MKATFYSGHLYRLREDLLSGTALRVLEIIMRRDREGKPPPSFDELAAGAGISTILVHYLVHRLARAGLVTFVPGLRRTVRPSCRFIPADRLGAGISGEG